MVTDAFWGSGNRLVPLYRRLDTNDYHDYHEFSPSGGCAASWVTPYVPRCVFVTWPSLPIMKSIFDTVARSFSSRLAISTGGSGRPSFSNRSMMAWRSGDSAFDEAGASLSDQQALSLSKMRLSVCSSTSRPVT